ncbi:MAG: nitrite reductase/ring-hydroxylating ferredoxin subunit [Chlamydiales bacterium]|jgi:nitrite reductase/ring-hydroxylating ferredoxin subunit
MIGRILNLFRRAPVLIPGTAALAEGEARKVDIGDPAAGGTQILLCRVDGEVSAIDTLCPHEGGRLAAGPLTDGRLALCPLHSFRFDPKTGKAVGVSCKAARVYRTRESDEGTEVWA